jgi:hypothetical protein
VIVVPLGQIVSAVPGTRVRVTATPTPCYGVIAVPLPGNAGVSYFGTSTLTKASGVGVIKAFLKPSATGINDQLQVNGPDGNQMNAADYYIDAETAADGFQISYISM